MPIKFKYTNNVATLHSIDIYLSHRLLVVGDPTNAAYEWVLLNTINGSLIIENYSDAAYGSPEIALRDGLIAILGTNTDGEINTKTTDTYVGKKWK